MGVDGTHCHSSSIYSAAFWREDRVLWKLVEGAVNLVNSSGVVPVEGRVRSPQIVTDYSLRGDTGFCGTGFPTIPFYGYQLTPSFLTIRRHLDDSASNWHYPSFPPLPLLKHLKPTIVITHKALEERIIQIFIQTRIQDGDW